MYDLGVNTLTKEILTGCPVEMDDDYYLDNDYNKEQIQETRRKLQWAKDNLSVYGEWYDRI